MKNVFGVNVKTTEFDGKPLIIRKLSEDLTNEQKNIRGKMEQNEKRTTLPAWLKITQFILYLIGMCFVMVVLNLLLEMPIAKVWKNGSVVIIIGAVSLAIAVSLRIVERKKKKDVEESEDYQALEKHAESVIEQSYNDLKVPQDATQFDALVWLYKEKKNGKKVTAMMYDNQRRLLNAKIFKQDNYVCIADARTVWGIPVDNLVKIKKISKSVLVGSWHKAERYDKGQYKQYNIKLTGVGLLAIKPYCALQFAYEGEDFELFFPNYELETVCSITGLQVEEPKKEKAEE